jgi:iron complex transport system ATP-binding protein
MTMPLEVYNLTGGYGDRPIVNHLNLRLQQGEWLSLVGANGSGKSTLLRLISRILVPQEGTVLLDGKALHHLSAQAIAQHLAILPQHNKVPAGLTVRQLVSLGRAPYQPWWQWEPDAGDRQQIAVALEQTGMTAYGDRLLEQLSGGERQRAFLALALAQSPRVLLLDEPTTYLDIHYQLQLLELLKLLNQQGLAIVTVLHDVNLAARYSDRLAMLQQGHIWAIGPPSEVLTPANLVAVFNVEVAILNTPVGLQICPLWPSLENAIAAQSNGRG